MTIVKNIQSVATYLKGLEKFRRYPVVSRYPVKGCIDVNNHITEVSAQPHLQITRNLLESVFVRWRKNIGIGSLYTENVGFEDISVLLPNGNSRDYMLELRRFVTQVFGHSPQWAERDNFLAKLHPDTRLDGLRCLLYHPFLRNPVERAQDFRNFVEFYRGKKVNYGYFRSLRSAFDEWERKNILNNPYVEGIEDVCRRNDHTFKVYQVYQVYQYGSPTTLSDVEEITNTDTAGSKVSNGTTGAFSNAQKNTNLQARIDVSSFGMIDKVILSQHIIDHLNDHVECRATPYPEWQKYVLVEELFPGIHMLGYDFRWEAPKEAFRLKLPTLLCGRKRNYKWTVMKLSFFPSLPERVSFAALQPVSGSSQSELVILEQVKLKAMELKNTIHRLDNSLQFVKDNISMVAAKLAIQSVEMK